MKNKPHDLIGWDSEFDEEFPEQYFSQTARNIISFVAVMAFILFLSIVVEVMK